MGENLLKRAGLSCKVVYEPPSAVTSAKDTKKLCRLFLDEDLDLILFCGGDGTARDVYSVVQDRVPILGIPADVKMYAGVFALNPESAGELLKAFLEGKTIIGVF
jgi:predicted polyphosphate/ATP-dependent NAD kinase